jgi:hypothetical protein
MVLMLRLAGLKQMIDAWFCFFMVYGSVWW